MLLVSGLILIGVGIIVALIQASTGLYLVVAGLLMFAMGYDLNAIRERLPEPPKPPPVAKRLRLEQQRQARVQKPAHLAEEAQAANEGTGR